jgi:NAD(P)H-dependent FMN reductase
MCWTGLSAAPPDTVFGNKVAALASASPGALGGMRVGARAGDVPQSLGVLTLSRQMAVPRARGAFDEKGELCDARLGQALACLASALVGTTRAPHAVAQEVGLRKRDHLSLFHFTFWMEQPKTNKTG